MPRAPKCRISTSRSDRGRFGDVDPMPSPPMWASPSHPWGFRTNPMLTSANATHVELHQGAHVASAKPPSGRHRHHARRPPPQGLTHPWAARAAGKPLGCQKPSSIVFMIFIHWNGRTFRAGPSSDAASHLSEPSADLAEIFRCESGSFSPPSL